MYGTIRRNYGVKRASDVSESIVERSFENKKNKKRYNVEDLQQTKYMKVDASSYAHKREAVATSDKKRIFKNEFPVSSIILTIVITMMAMVFAFGFGGIWRKLNIKSDFRIFENHFFIFVSNILEYYYVLPNIDKL